MDALPLLDVAKLSPPLNKTLVTCNAQLDLVAGFLDRETEFGFDVETNIVSFYRQRWIRTIQVGNRNEQYVIDLLALCNWDTKVFVESQTAFGAKIEEGHPLHKLIQILRPALDGNKHLKLGYNLEFDYTACWWCLGLRAWNFYDAYLTEQVIWCGRVPFHIKDFWALDDVVGRYCKLKIDKSKQRSFDTMEPLTEEQVTYAALDTRLIFAVRESQRQVIKAAGLERAEKIEHDAIPAFADLHINGFHLDVEKWNVLIDGFKKKHIENIATLDEHFLPLVGVAEPPVFDLTDLEFKWRSATDKATRKQYREQFYAARAAVREFEKEKDSYEGKAAINYGSNPQLLEALRKFGFTEKELPSTDDRFLKRHSSKPIIKALQDYRETGKILSTYGDSFIKQFIEPSTGLVHARFRQIGAETGRTSCVQPNLQNIKKEKEWRACFTALIGRKILTIDYNGCELRILAELSQEPVWIEAFKNGWDVHSLGAEIVFGELWTNAAEPDCAYVARHEKCECKSHKKLRGRIKSINFGLAYGMQAKKLADELGISEKEAEGLLNTYKGKFVVVIRYLEQSGSSAKTNFSSRTMSGRRRLFHKPTFERAKQFVIDDATAYTKRKKMTAAQAADYMMRNASGQQISRKIRAMMAAIEREGKNTPIQGTNADMVKLAMGCGFDSNAKPFLWHLLRQFNVFMVNMVHDELVFDSSNQESSGFMPIAQDAMERAGAEFVKSIPMTTEGTVADCWVK